MVEKIELIGVSGSDYDALISAFPGLEDHTIVTPADSQPGEQEEIGMVNVIIELGPPVINFSAALLTYLAARYTFKRRD